MATPASAAQADQPGRRPGWLVLTASERGASHLAMQSPNQDSVGYERAGSTGMVAAVADGHGHSRHLRSARGSLFAVRVGCQVAQELADRLEASPAIFPQPSTRASRAAAATEITALASDFLVPEIVSRWRAAVLADVTADPFTEAEEDMRLFGDDATIAYGSTLLLALAVSDWLILSQIGDGDVVVVRPDGRAILPVPTDPQLDGMVTTSLCGSDPESDFRVAIVDASRTSMMAVMLASDGYGNAQVMDDWPGAFSHDMAWLIKEHDVNWLASQLPVWAARCASAEGSADDTTVALLLSQAALPKRPTSPQGGTGGSGSGSEETTIPAFPHAETVPSTHVPAGQHPTEPVTIRQATVPPDSAEQAMPHHAEHHSHGITVEVIDPDELTGAEAGPAATEQATGPGSTAQVTAPRDPSGEGTVTGEESGEPPTTRWDQRPDAGADT
jgi:serine/threonine protein phosphatase PrpC